MNENILMSMTRSSSGSKRRNKKQEDMNKNTNCVHELENYRILM